jgi:dephospho-CoA kinase
MGFIVGLTGGIGSGKSTVADLFCKLGVVIVDTDAIAHALTVRDGRAIASIRKSMGAQFIGEDGALDRSVTRERAFSDRSVRLQLEAILHPLIHEEVEFALCADAVPRVPYAMLAVPLLFESLTYRKRTQRTLVIDCPVAAQLERVKRRSRLSADFASRIVDAQLPRSIRLQLADDVIWNGDVAGALHSQVESLHILYAQKARNVR